MDPKLIFKIYMKDGVHLVQPTGICLRLPVFQQAYFLFLNKILSSKSRTLAEIALVGSSSEKHVNVKYSNH